MNKKFKNLKNLDFLLYLSSSLSLMLILVLLTSSKSISYDIDKTKKLNNIDPIELNINAFVPEEKNEINKLKTAEIIKASDQAKENAKIALVKPDNDLLIKDFKEVQSEPEKIDSSVNKTNLNDLNKEMVQYYIVKKGDNLSKISSMFNISLESLLKLNNIKNPNFIVIGQELKLHANNVNYSLTIKSEIIHHKDSSLENNKPNNNKSGKIKFYWPVKGKITSEFGVRSSPLNNKMGFHFGLDIAANFGSDYCAAESGVVIFSGMHGGYGKTIIIQHKNGYKTAYCHSLISYVSARQYVEKGQVIGRVGNTGVTTGPHLHFEIRKNDIALDPTTFIDKKQLY